MVPLFTPLLRPNHPLGSLGLSHTHCERFPTPRGVSCYFLDGGTSTIRNYINRFLSAASAKGYSESATSHYGFLFIGPRVILFYTWPVINDLALGPN